MDNFPELSRFAIRDMGKTVAAGMFAIEKKELVTQVMIERPVVTTIRLTGENHDRCKPGL